MKIVKFNKYTGNRVFQNTLLWALLYPNEGEDGICLMEIKVKPPYFQQFKIVWKDTVGKIEQIKHVIQGTVNICGVVGERGP